MTTSTIKVTLTVAFADLPNQSMRVTAIFEPSDPYAVQFRFPTSPTWTFARNLLAEGLKSLAGGPVGEGDITIGPTEADDYVEIVLHPRSSKPTRLYARRDELGPFVAQAYKRVPDEREDDYIDWDGAWSALRRQTLDAGGGA
ncbi:hypothetical protein HD597_012884 [Nonomuraea thailandensis]|uniref:SsgA family sporulation/cell division regulator n=1 Tax=Nonomuraea thailandensis TaxID=1188745 RepID=A0A9X2GXG6_9ACTN|nr:SsgA family sporulation/cell division regulator [Nonomuraea thailandensis]MCP2365780.1 hypothetical protein [Nonomuraea thailandensis]